MGSQPFCAMVCQSFSVCAHRCATDHNVDNTTELLQEWLAAVGPDYAAVVWKPEEETR